LTLREFLDIEVKGTTNQFQISLMEAHAKMNWQVLKIHPYCTNIRTKYTSASSPNTYYIKDMSVEDYKFFYDMKKLMEKFSELDERKKEMENDFAKDEQLNTSEGDFEDVPIF
jgi:hypothetical protein